MRRVIRDPTPQFRHPPFINQMMTEIVERGDKRPPVEDMVRDERDPDRGKCHGIWLVALELKELMSTDIEFSIDVTGSQSPRSTN